jgi:rubrerythrin
MSTPVQGLDYGKLTLKDALDLAVLIEEEAKERYTEFADQMQLHHNAEAESFFRFMAVNEEKHRAELAGRRARLFGDQPATVSSTMIFDVEAPEYDEARAFMTARHAMEAALRCECKAHAFFVGVLGHIQDPAVRELFEELREEEVHHQALVQREIERLPPDSGFKPDDFADEPVAQ